MKKLLFLILIIFVLLLNFSLEAQKSKVDKIKYPKLRSFNLPQVQTARTANGIKLRLIQEGKLPIVSLYALFKGGDAYERAKDNFGIASVCAQLMRIGGTREHKPAELDKLLDNEGITISVSSSTNYYTVSLSCLKEKFPRAVALLAEILTGPAFNKDKLSEILTRSRSAISRRNDQPSSINSREFAKLIYGSSSPHGAVLEYEDLDRITIPKIRAIYRQYFAPSNMLTGVIGPLSMEEVKAAFEKNLGSWQNQARFPSLRPVTEVKHPFRVGLIHKDNLTQSYLSLGHLGIKGKLSPEETARIRVFNNIFSGGFSSRLMQRVRVKMGLTYGIGGGISLPNLHKGRIYVSTFTKSKSTLKAIDAILEEIKILRKEQVTPKELKDAKDYFKNSFVFKYATPAQILLRRLTSEFYGIEPGFDKALLEKIGQVTAEDVLKVAQTYLHPEKMMIQVVGNQKEIKKEEFNKYGKLKEIDITIPKPKLKEKIPPATRENLARGLKLMQGSIKKNYGQYKKLKSVELQYSMKMNTPRGEMAMDVRSVNLYPDKGFTEISVMGMKIQQVVNGDKGYMNQMGRKQNITADQIKEGRFSRMYDLFHKTDLCQFQYLKDVKLEGKDYHVIYLTRKDYPGKWAKLFMNQKTLLVEINESMGAQGLTKTVNSDFKTVRGIPFAHKTIMYTNGKKTREMVVKAVKVNPRVDQNLFKLK